MRRFKVQSLKKIFCVTVVVMLIFAMTAPCFAIGLALDAVDFWSIGWQLYCEQHGFKNYFTTNGQSNTATAPAGKSTAQLMWEQLFLQYRTDNPNSSSISDIGQAVYDGLTANWTPVSGSETLYNMITLSAAVVGHYDEFASWLFETKMNMDRTESGAFHTSGSFTSPVISSYSSYDSTGFTYVPVVNSLTSSNILNNGIEVCKNKTGSAVNIAGSIIDNVYVFVYGSNNGLGIGVISTDPIDYDEVGIAQTGWNGVGILSQYQSDNGYYCRYNVTEVSVTNSLDNVYVPYYASLSDAITAFLDNVIDSDPVNSSIAVAPKEKVRQGDGDIYIPDPTANDYIPQSLYIPTNVPYVDTDSKDNVLDKILEQLLANDDVTDLTDAISPAPVISPYIPFNIPSFNFNFSGIWHYVIEWVGSLGSGLSFFGSTWSNIPYAMVVPVYATAVIVIVTSIFKRFV